jgi:transcriptional regulator with XRE-family HTH domain
MSPSDDEMLEHSPFSRVVGERLRSIRSQKNLSLSEVEIKSNEEFKASVLGAYERGERAISVPRLERLAKFYGVTLDQLLPRDPLRVETISRVLRPQRNFELTWQNSRRAKALNSRCLSVS